MIAEGMKIVAAGANPVQLIRGIEKTVEHLVRQEGGSGVVTSLSF